MAPPLNFPGKTFWVPITVVRLLSLVAYPSYPQLHGKFLDFVFILHSNDTILRLPGTQQERYQGESNGRILWSLLVLVHIPAPPLPGFTELQVTSPL